MNTPRLLPVRDLIKDELGNYYDILYVDNQNSKVVLVNAVVKLSSNRILTDDYYREHQHEVLTHEATNILKAKIKNLNEGKVPGDIYSLEELKSDFGFEFVVEGLYDPSPKVN
ncbi:hypothetical protein [Paenibacillus sp. PAMC 26794]|uniref:hypothetical protein n=1 Tax=Paenibacillus sp. PAMC 26794 TaxID=1257080 RepID=UPI0002DD7B34|nr:hypothetical protein [Paenibacillus sp. PAMC 26794]